MKFNFKNLALLSVLGGVFLFGCKEEKKAPFKHMSGAFFIS